MIIIPNLLNLNGGGVTKNSAISILIVFNLLLLVSFCVLYYLFTKENYDGTFWAWTWDDDFRYNQFRCCNFKYIDTYAGMGVIFLWIPLFYTNGIAIVFLLISLVEKFIQNLYKN